MVRKMRNALGYFIPVHVARITSPEGLHDEMEDFFTMMRENADKNRFLTDPMAAQMHAVAQAAAENGWLDLRFLVVGREKAAAYLNFIYDNKVWVYNSALGEKFAAISPGISLVGLLIQEAIEEGRTEFDLLRGDEEYKYQLGGQDRWVVKAVISR
jgi:CelD/BcsL family acetyltransferase involved in cellulose biosynthesis